MEFFSRSGHPAKQKTACAVVAIFETGKMSSAAAQIDKTGKGFISRVIKRGDMDGTAGRTLMIDGVRGVSCQRVLLVGCGKPRKYNRRAFRKSLTTAVGNLLTTGCVDAISHLGDELVVATDAYYIARYTVETVATGSYRFEQMKSKKGKMPKLKKFGLAMPGRSEKNAADRAIRDGSAISVGASLTRDLGNLPSNVCTPSHLAKTGRDLAKKYKKVETTVYTEAQMKRMGMNALLSVTAGAMEPAKLIIVRYRGAPASKKPYVLVGKGVTFDTGGVCLKPPPGMEEMKFDMCGAATVMGVMRSVAQLQLPINLIGVVPACENMPGSAATRPGDIVKSMSGQTIEIINTDAEGRLILCDALTFAQKFKPAVLLDIATLTGSCVVALGAHMTGLMTHDDKLADSLLQAGVDSDDQAWRLPLTEDYDEPLNTSFADFKNVASREGGAEIAGCFLGRFTKGVRWAHLDIAGTAWKSGGRPHATGRPVPMLVDYLIRESQNG